MTRPDRPPIAVLLPLVPLAFAVVALGPRRAWVSGVAALLVTALLWRRHPRARFTAYVFFSALALRGLWRQEWVDVALAAAAIALLQLPAAGRVWPRLQPGATRARNDRMPGP